MTYRRHGVGYLGAAPAGKPSTSSTTVITAPPAAKGSSPGGTTFTARPVTATYTAPVSAITRFVPTECAEVKALVGGREYSSGGFVIPNPIPLGTVVVVAARLPREVAPSVLHEMRKNIWDYLVRRGVHGLWQSVDRNGSTDLTVGDMNNANSFHPPVDGVFYLVFKCISVACGRNLINAAATKLQTEIRAKTGVAVTAMSAKSASTRWGHTVSAALAAVGGLEDFQTVLTALFSTSVAWDYRRAFLTSETQDSAMTRSIQISQNVTGLAQGYLATAQAVRAQAQGIPTSDPIAADGAFAAIDRELARIDGLVVRDMEALNAGPSAAAARPSAALERELPTLAESVRGYVQTKISRLAGWSGLNETRRKFLSCRWWTEAENQYPVLEANLQVRIARTRELEAWFANPANLALLGPALEALNAVRSQIAILRQEIADRRSQLNLPWYLKRFGPLPVWAWGAIGGVGLIGGAVLLKKKKSATPAKLAANRSRS